MTVPISTCSQVNLADLTFPGHTLNAHCVLLVKCTVAACETRSCSQRYKMSVTRNRPCDISASNQLRSTSSDAPTSIPHLPTDPEALIYPEGALTEDTVELLHEFVHPHHRHRTMPASANEVPNAIELEVPDNDENMNKEEMGHRPWHRRPSPWW